MTTVLNINTPVEKYRVKDIMGYWHTVYVKREDLCTPFPGPPFSKVRGLYTHMQLLKSLGIETVGYTESAISMAGWGVAWVAAQLGMKAIIFDPQYKNKTPDLLKIHRQKWDELKAERISIPAGRTKVNFYRSQRILKTYSKAMMLPIGLRLQSTVRETAIEWTRTQTHAKTVVVCVGSGTICAGILLGSRDSRIHIVGVMSYGSNPQKKAKDIKLKAGRVSGGLVESVSKADLTIINQGWDYAESSKATCPFPCHPYYDLKAWEWLTKNIDRLEHPVMFWNIGSEAK